MIWLLLTLLACADPASEPIDCEGLPEAECEAAPKCWTRAGRPVHGDDSCEEPGPTRFAGCATGSTVCPDVPNFRAPPDAPTDCWTFGNACAPVGWVKCDPTPYCEGDSGLPD